MFKDLKVINSTLLVIFVLLFFPGNIKSQDDNERLMDSLVHVIENNNVHDTIIVQSYIKLAKMYLDIDLDSVNYYAEKAKFISEQIDFKKGLLA